MRLRCPTCKEVVRFPHEKAEGGKCRVLCPYCDALWELEFDPTHRPESYENLNLVSVYIESGSQVNEWELVHAPSYQQLTPERKSSWPYVLAILFALVGLVVVAFVVRPDLISVLTHGSSTNHKNGSALAQLERTDKKAQPISDTPSSQPSALPSTLQQEGDAQQIAPGVSPQDSNGEVAHDQKTRKAKSDRKTRRRRSRKNHRPEIDDAYVPDDLNSDDDYYDDEEDDAYEPSSVGSSANRDYKRAGQGTKLAELKIVYESDDESSPQNEEDSSFGGRLSQARRLASSGRRKEAIEHYSSLYAEDADNMQIAFEFGKVLMAQGSYARAREVLRRLVQNGGPNESEALLISARAEDKLGRSHNAYELYDEYLKRFPYGIGANEAKAYVGDK